jgi:hypothetical protein
MKAVEAKELGKEVGTRGDEQGKEKRSSTSIMILLLYTVCSSLGLGLGPRPGLGIGIGLGLGFFLGTKVRHKRDMSPEGVGRRHRW